MLRKEAAYCELTGASGTARGRPRGVIGLGCVDIESLTTGRVFSLRDAGGSGRFRNSGLHQARHGISLGVFGLEFSVHDDAYISIVKANDRRT